jgi:hypothetical protein
VNSSLVSESPLLTDKAISPAEGECIAPTDKLKCQRQSSTFNLLRSTFGRAAFA